MKTIILAMAFLILSIPAYADDKAFCEDPKMWEYFESMTAKYPDDIPLQLLHALRIGLCEKVSDNTIRLEGAITIFNNMVDVVANQRDQSVNSEKL